MPELSRRDFDMACKVFKSNTPGCETSAWYRTFKQSFELIREHRREAQRQERQAEEDRINQAKLRNDERKARLMAEIEKSKREEFKERPMLQAILTPLTHQPGEQASSSVGPHGALTAEPASSGEASQAKRGDYVPQTPLRSTQNQCQICGLSVHEHSKTPVQHEVLSNLEMRCFRGKMHMLVPVPESTTADGRTSSFCATGMGCQG